MHIPADPLDPGPPPCPGRVTAPVMRESNVDDPPAWEAIPPVGALPPAFPYPALGLPATAVPPEPPVL